MVNLKKRFGSKLEKLLLSIKFKNLHVFDFSIIDVESQGCSHKMKTLDTRRARIDDQHIQFLIPYNLEDVGVATDEDIRHEITDQLTRSHIIFSRISTYMSHKNFKSFTLKEPVWRVIVAENEVITVADYAYKWFEIGYFFSQLQSAAKISGMPDLVYRLEKILEFPAEYTVGV